MTGGRVVLSGLTKSYGDEPAVRGIDLAIAPGEFFSLLGPSGCGKTTTLRMIAGFERPDTGQILIDDVDVAPVPPNRRPVNTVFQSYALFPFMTVRDNVAFGLSYAKATKDEARARVDEALRLVQMAAFDARRPGQLSGGQQQRVALARALVLRPKVLLLDEPLGALDAKLRKDLQVELKELQRTVGITFVYVTHDQEEALTMSDRLAVLADGLVEQVGAPAEVYAEPASAYVASFLGSANVLDAHVLSGDGVTSVCRLSGHQLTATGSAVTGAVTLVVRPERVELRNGQDAPLVGTVDRVTFLGSATHVRLRLSDGQRLLASLTNSAGGTVPYRVGDTVGAFVAPDACRLLPPDTRAPVAVDEEAAPVG